MSEIKVGDRVHVVSYGAKIRTVTVIGETESFFITEGCAPEKWRKSDLTKVGKMGIHQHIEPIYESE